MLEGKMRIDSRTAKITRRFHDFCGRWFISLMSPNSNTWRTKADRLNCEKKSHPCSIDDIVEYQNTIQSFQQQHLKVIDDILNYREHYLSDNIDYVNNPFCFDFEPYLERTYPLIKIYDQIAYSHDDVDVNTVVTDIINWVSSSFY
jgi:hypothetical protein